MKKVLALVLAVMMMATVAFATTADGVVKEDNSVNFGGASQPGKKLYVYRGMDSGDELNGAGVTVNDVDISTSWNANINSSNYSITSQKWTKGKDLLDGNPYFDDDKNQLVIKLKEDYTLKQPKTLSGKFTLKGKGKGGDKVGGKDTKPNNIDVNIELTVGNFKAAIYLDKENDRTIEKTDVDDNTVYKFQKIDQAKDGLVDALDNSISHPTDDYGTVVLNTEDDDVEVTFRGYKNDELFLYNDTDANNALLKAYADKDAEISFLSFAANPTLNSTATVRFYKDEDSYVYVMKDGKLTSEVKWDDDESAFVLKTRTLGSYVFSDKALPMNAEVPGNPDTGANDVVGIATALAAVALVSAAAVSLKK